MSNPTSNFGWQMPQPTDLVTDLPADFEVFGQAVDTSLADLKGGSTGQVLSKNSNTDMDFVWVTSDDANAIQNSIVNAKGDIIGASANDTPAITSVGANGEMLVADSTTATGLDWKTATEQYPWQTWTPSYFNLTIGNGTVIARYQQIGKLVNVFFRLTFGSTTTFTSYPQISLPVLGARNNYLTNGTSHIEDAGVTAYTGPVYMESNDRFQALGNFSNTTYTNAAFLTANTIPFTWGTNDFLQATFTYEAV